MLLIKANVNGDGPRLQGYKTVRTCIFPKCLHDFQYSGHINKDTGLSTSIRWEQVHPHMQRHFDVKGMTSSCFNVAFLLIFLFCFPLVAAEDCDWIQHLVSETAAASQAEA